MAAFLDLFDYDYDYDYDYEHEKYAGSG